MVTLNSSFNEHVLGSKLGTLSEKSISAFAAACSTRLIRSLSNYRNNHDDICCGEVAIESLWAYLLHGDELDINRLEESLLSRISDEEDSLSFATSVADDAFAAAVYALRTVKTEHVQNACWAARRAYDLVDRYAARTANVPEFTDAVEQAITEHPVVKAELARQSRDISFLARWDLEQTESGMADLMALVSTESTIPSP